ncbi:MAG: site-2 protease family protein [Miltoncostaeaceae bacterium]
MRATYSLGRLFGVRLGVNWSVLALLGLLMWLLATEVFPETNPGLSADAHFAMAVVAALAFFGSIVLHELGHAVQARRDGMAVDGITLWLFGGVASFRGGFPSAAAEFRIAAAGPAVSALLAAVFLGVWYLPGIPEAIAGVVGWLGVINVALLIFNLIPALPLDGGRLLRAAIWRVGGDFRRATRISARIAQVLAIGLVALGLFIALTLGGISGLWLALIAWFLLQAARSELAMAERAATWPGEADLMAPAPAPVGEVTTLAAVVEREGWPLPHAAYPVTDERGATVGLLLTGPLDEDPDNGWLDQRAGQRMVPRASLATLSVRDDLVTAVAALGASEAGRALVMEAGRVVGLLSRDDIEVLGARAGLTTPGAGSA